MTAAPEGHRRPVSQLSIRELELYGNQLERCLKALSTGAPIRADVQRELAAVHAVRQPRTQAGQSQQHCRPRDVSGLTASELERTRRELAANLALVRARLTGPRADPDAHHHHRHRTGQAIRLATLTCSPREYYSSPERTEALRRSSRFGDRSGEGRSGPVVLVVRRTAGLGGSLNGINGASMLPGRHRWSIDVVWRSRSQ
jgi:hypothetical protein